jgi:hypothetical protein
MKKIVVLIALLLVVGWFASSLIRSSNLSQSTASNPPAPVFKTIAVAPKNSSAETNMPPVPDIVPIPEAPVAATRKQPEDNLSLAYPQMVLSEVMQPGNVFHDSVFGVSATLPEGWSVRHATRWGENNRENTVFFSPPEGSKAIPSMYYQKYRETPPLGNADAYLREVARQKEASRLQNGMTEYQNDPGSFVYREVGGIPSLSYSATYISKSGEVHAEYFTRILGPDGYVMFFVRGPVKDVQTLIPSVYEMSGTVTPP